MCGLELKPFSCWTFSWKKKKVIFSPQNAAMEKTNKQKNKYMRVRHGAVTITDTLSRHTHGWCARVPLEDRGVGGVTAVDLSSYFNLWTLLWHWSRLGVRQQNRNRSWILIKAKNKKKKKKDWLTAQACWCKESITEYSRGGRIVDRWTNLIHVKRRSNWFSAQNWRADANSTVGFRIHQRHLWNICKTKLWLEWLEKKAWFAVTKSVSSKIEHLSAGSD